MFFDVGWPKGGAGLRRSFSATQGTFLTPILLTTVATVLAVVLLGCAAPAASVPSYEELVARTADTAVPPAALRRAFLARDDFDERLRELMELEAQVLATLDERPLRLGAVGSAILDLHYGSLAGHQALARFYAHVDAPQQAAYHTSWVDAIRADIEGSGDGTSDNPYKVLFVNQAKAYLAASGLTAIGSAYGETEAHPFMLWVTARSEAGRVQHLYFDLAQTYDAYEEAVGKDETTLLPVSGQPLTCREMGLCEAFNTSAFVHLLARGEDSAAQVLIGRTLAAYDNRLEEAAEWLLQAAQLDNALANLSLGELCLDLASRAGSNSAQVWLERAERRFLLAAAGGFDDAMVQLADMYLRGYYGPDQLASAVPLFERAAGLDNAYALYQLGQLHASGIVVDRDLEAAERYHLRAAEVDDEAKVAYAEFLVNPAFARMFNDQAYEWVRQAAKQGSARGMLVLAQLFHVGQHVDQSVRRARSWFKKAVKAAPDDPHVVNQAAWTLTVTRTPKLRDPGYAVRIMDRVMAAEDADARTNPAYLDTWAAAYAASGDFERAISIQQEAIAIEQARTEAEGGRSDLAVLLEHLAAFRAGERISDDGVP